MVAEAVRLKKEAKAKVKADEHVGEEAARGKAE